MKGGLVHSYLDRGGEEQSGFLWGEDPQGTGKGMWWFKEEAILINTMKYPPATPNVHSQVGVARKAGWLTARNFFLRCRLPWFIRRWWSILFKNAHWFQHPTLWLTNHRSPDNCLTCVKMRNDKSYLMDLLWGINKGAVWEWETERERGRDSGKPLSIVRPYIKRKLCFSKGNHNIISHPTCSLKPCHVSI